MKSAVPRKRWDGTWLAALALGSIALATMGAAGCGSNGTATSESASASGAGGSGHGPSGTSTASGSGSGTGGGILAGTGGGTSTGTGTGGQGGSACSESGSCSMDADCPSLPGGCVSAKCVGSCCAIQNAPSGTSCDSSGGKVCDGNGSCIGCLVAADCPDPGTSCATAVCSNGSCGTTLADKGTTCADHGGTVCDGNGSCTAEHCADGVKDADESAVDCGGSCPGCTVGQTCTTGADCADQVCSGTPATCQMSTCTDGVKNGAETDKDCGGSCPKCTVKQGCSVDGDCDTANCKDGKCAPKKNGDTCSADGDCDSAHCVAGMCCDTGCSGTCQACTKALTGAADGTCSNIQAGKPAPAGQCTASTCKNDGMCDGAGACEQVKAGTTCDDGNACTKTDVCMGGACVGTNPVTCAASDQCHGAGTCDKTTGACSNPALADGTTCSDGNACTTGDTCQAGACQSGTAKTCAASDQCHTAGTCDPTSGACSNPAKANGAACDDGNACTISDTCQAGACKPGTAKDCSGSADACNTGVCNPTTGACGKSPTNIGGSCDDMNACTGNGLCAVSGGVGVCQGASPLSDLWEPNNSASAPAVVNDVDDCSTERWFLNANINPNTDVDWYFYHTTNTSSFCDYGSFVQLDPPAGENYDLTVCVYEPGGFEASCAMGAPVANVVVGGATYACCQSATGGAGASEIVKVDWSCGTFCSDNTGNVLVKVSPSGGSQACTASTYKLTWYDD